MRPFTVGGVDYTESIVFCASDRDGLAVTTAVHASRTEEPELLHALLDTTANSPYIPFSEDRHSKVDADRELYEATIDANATCLSIATTSKGGDEDDQAKLHAVNGALLLERLLPEATAPLLVSTIGDTHARELLRAAASDRCSVSASEMTRSPTGATPSASTLTHASKMWWYYPTAMVGGLASQYLSHAFSTGRIPNLYFNVRVLRGDGPSGRGIDRGRAQSELDYQCPGTERCYADSKAERMYCWYAGLLPVGDPGERVTPSFAALEEWLSDSDNERFLSLLRMFR